jgi:hypothetical protein
MPQGARLRLLHNGDEAASSLASPLVHSVDSASGAYRVEVGLDGVGRASAPWIVSNPIYFGTDIRPPERATSDDAPITETAVVYGDGPATDWRLEKNPASEGALDVVASVGGTQLSLRYGLGGVLSEGPYVAAVVPVAVDVSQFDRLALTARAARPMRVSVQVRAPEGTEGRRWKRSVYLDEAARAVTIRCADMTPVDPASGPPPLANLRDLLVVVDTVNSEPGTGGQIWIDDLRYER